MENILTLDTTTNGGPGPMRLFWRRTGQILLHPARFFREDFARMDTPAIVAFGLTNAWLADAAAFFVSTFNSFFLARLFERWAQRLLVGDDGFSFLNITPKSFLWASGLVLLSPFLQLLGTLLATLTTYFFVRLLVEEEGGSPDPVSFASVFRIKSAALVGRWFRMVPVVGGLVGFVITVILTVTGLRERFAISNRRASAIVLAPYLLLFILGMMLLVVLGVALYQLPMQEMFEGEGFGI